MTGLPLGVFSRARQRTVLFPSAYSWFVLVSTLDVLLTWIVLFLGGKELNQLALNVLQRWALPGLLVYKFGLVCVVILICEFVGRRDHDTGRRLSRAAVIITAVAPALATLQVWRASP